MSEANESAVRAEVRAWLEANWDPGLSLIEWRNRLVDSGWGAPSWPRQWHGRDLPAGLVPAVDEEFARAGAVGVAKVGIRVMAAAVLLAHGTDDQKRRFLRRSLTGEDAWCQLFSEPGSGSDVAGASTRADFDGTKWIVNGQKLWISGAQKADWGLLLARTDWNRPKHAGLSFFVIDMHQPGVVVQPLQQMNGHSTFNQVFITDAIVPPENQVDAIGNGWAVATTTLMHERRISDGIGRWTMRASERAGRVYEEERVEIEIALAPYKWYPNRAGRVDLVLPRAKETGAIHDPVIRQEIAKLLVLAKSAEWTGRRARSAQEQGRPQGPEGSIGKLAASHIARAAARVHTAISGADALLTGPASPLDGTIAEILVSVPATSIAGGTDEIQRNIISERVLGMPREADADKGKPYKDVPRNVVG